MLLPHYHNGLRISSKPASIHPGLLTRAECRRTADPGAERSRRAHDVVENGGPTKSLRTVVIVSLNLGCKSKRGNLTALYASNEVVQISLSKGLFPCWGPRESWPITINLERRRKCLRCFGCYEAQPRRAYRPFQIPQIMVLRIGHICPWTVTLVLSVQGSIDILTIYRFVACLEWCAGSQDSKNRGVRGCYIPHVNGIPTADPPLCLIRMYGGLQ